MLIEASEMRILNFGNSKFEFLAIFSKLDIFTCEASIQILPNKSNIRVLFLLRIVSFTKQLKYGINNFNSLHNYIK